VVCVSAILVLAEQNARVEAMVISIEAVHCMAGAFMHTACLIVVTIASAVLTRELVLVKSVREARWACMGAALARLITTSISIHLFFTLPICAKDFFIELLDDVTSRTHECVT
jgi:hypothetical protein